MNNPVEDRRSVTRENAKIAVELLHDKLRDAVTRTCNYSDVGVLVERMPGTGILQAGMVIDVRVSGIMGLPSQVLEARVVRIDDEGIALEFIQPISSS
ncbi:PilZ domain-containing protein [Kaarinaea lacus]|jgi:hypothetical protein